MKKKVLDGQPLYMAQYTALMIILLAFFIVMQSLSTVKESGFKTGMGDVKNAFGISGGIGIFGYIVPSRGSTSRDNPVGSGTSGRQGLHENLVKGEGGVGNTDANTEKVNQGKYLQVKLPITFEKGKAAITLEGRAVLDKMKVGLMLYDYKITIKCFANDNKNPAMDNPLAVQRATNIMRYLHQEAQVPYQRLEALGNSSIRYYSNIKPDAVPEQEVFLYIFHHGSTTNKTT